MLETFWPALGAGLLGLFVGRYLLALGLRILMQRTPPPPSTPALEQIYSARGSSQPPDANEAVEIAKQTKLPMEEVNSWFRQKLQSIREVNRTKQTIECLWTFGVLLASALLVGNWKARLGLHVHLILLHLASFGDTSRAEFALVLGELVAKACVLGWCTLPWSDLMSQTHDPVDASFEFVKLVSLSKRFHRVSRGLFVGFALAWLGLKLAWFARQVALGVSADLFTLAPEFAPLLVLVGFDLNGAVVIADTIRGAFWTERDLSPTSVRTLRRDSDVSSQGFSSSHEYDSDSSMSSNLKHY
ncbi:hypothetical protein BASA81_012886 [Batrachochytrium salamandrivorans]|nr:hypothetical protein BASA81_012886 [Batrachochytrium salamandrivorans]